MVTRKHLRPLGRVDVRLVGTHIAHNHQQAVLAARLDDVGIVTGSAAEVFITALVVDACCLACSRHRLDFCRIGQPMLQEYARRSRHSQQVGISSQRVLLQRVLSSVRAFLRVVVLDEGHGVAAVGTALVVAADQRPVTVVLLCQTAVVTVVHRVAHRVAELEVEGRTLYLAVHLRAVNPVLDGVGAVPAFADAELRLCRGVIHTRISSRVALHHVVAEASIAQVVLQEVQIGLYNRLHILAPVVQVAHAVPALTRIVAAECDAEPVGLCLCLAVIVVSANVGRPHRVGHTLVRLRREPEPAVVALAVVNHHVGDGFDAILPIGIYEVAQLLLIAERAVVVLEPVQVVVAHRRASAIAALGQPHQVERTAQLVSLRLQHRPLRVVKGVPVETLQHDAAILCRPSLCSHAVNR